MATVSIAAPPVATPGHALRASLRQCVSFPALLGALLALITFIIVRGLRLDPDTWWHIKLGQDILATHHWATLDYFSFTTHGAAWIDYEWFGDVIISLAARAGLRGMDVLLIALTCTIVVLMYCYAWLRSGNAKAAFVACILVLPLAGQCFTLRPQLLGYIFLLLTLICLERFRAGHSGALWALPAIFFVWVNTHGSFTLGFVVLGAYWAGGLVNFSIGGLSAERWKPREHLRLGLCAVLSALVLPLTPYGARLALIPFRVASSLPLNFAHIEEWQSISFSRWEPKLLLGLLLAFLLAQITLRLKYRLDEMALFLVAAYATCVHFRFVLFFAIIFAPILAVLLARWVPRYEAHKDQFALNAAMMLLIMGGMVRYVPSEMNLGRKVREDYPVQAVEYMRQHPIAGPMFNSYGFGGYLVWSLGPAHRVFIDGRGDLYEFAGVFSDYIHIMDLEPDGLQILDRYGIQSCLIPRKEALAVLLAARSDWKQSYSDDLSVIFTRQPLAVACAVPHDASRKPQRAAGPSTHVVAGGGAEHALARLGGPAEGTAN
jgi:hypothetical protein